MPVFPAEMNWFFVCNEVGNPMDLYSISVAAGLRSRMQALDVLGNNVANAGTAGFKADRTFQAALSDAHNTNASVTRTWTDFSQGTIQSTGKDSDLALNGSGLFVVGTKSGPLYTRSGNFQVSPEGELVTAQGHKLLGEGGSPIKVAPGRPFEVNPDGTVEQDGSSAGKVSVVEFPANATLEKQGSSYYKPADGQPPPKPSQARIIQRSVENSNVSAAESSVEMITIMRQFESLQKALTLHGEMDKRTVEDGARTSGS